MDTAVDLNVFFNNLKGVKSIGNGQFTALCPFHEDKHQSFSFNINGLWHCFACKEAGNIQKFKEKLGLEVEVEMHKKNGIDEGKVINKIEYPYYDLDGVLNYIKVRKETENSKDFAIIKKNFKKMIFYNLPDIKKNEIWFAEGEKCAEALKTAVQKLDLNVGVLSFISFQSEWDEDLVRFIQDKNITLFEDNDETGRKNTKLITNTLKKYVKSIRLISFENEETHYDIADFLESNGEDSLSLLIEDGTYIYQNMVSEVYTFTYAQLVSESLKPPMIYLEDILDIPEGVCGIIASRGGEGKSTLSLYCALSLAEAGKRTLIISLEDNLRFIKYRLKALTDKFVSDKSVIENISIAKIHIGSLVTGTDWNQTGVTFFKDIEKFLKDYDFIFIDPIGVLLGDENNSQSAQKIIQKFQFLSERSNKNIILLHHTRKTGVTSDGDNINYTEVLRGSSALFDNSRWVAIIKRMETDLKVRIVKNNFYTLKTNIINGLFNY